VKTGDFRYATPFAPKEEPMPRTISLVWRVAPLILRASLRALPLVPLTVALAPAITITDNVSVGAVAAGATELTATWTDNAGGTANFKVERNTGTAGSYTEIGTTAPGVTNYVDTTVMAGMTYCYRVRASNAYGDSDYSNEACRQAGGAYDVTVTTTGTGSGTVVSSPSGIDCGTDCFESFVPGTVVTLTPTAAPESVFSGWGGGGCKGTGQCVMTGNVPVSITATFSSAPQPPPPSTSSYTLETTKSGTGWGTVVSGGGGIQCGSVCVESVAAGAPVTLTATAGKGSTFTGWTGAGCSGTGTCTVNVSESTTVDAAFTKTTMYSQP
jgi:hypothetical protein